MKHVENIILIICHLLSLVFIDNVPSLLIFFFQKNLSCCENGENVQQQKIKKQKQNNENGTVLGVAS